MLFPYIFFFKLRREPLPTTCLGKTWPPSLSTWSWMFTGVVTRMFSWGGWGSSGGGGGGGGFQLAYQSGAWFHYRDGVWQVTSNRSCSFAKWGRQGPRFLSSSWLTMCILVLSFMLYFFFSFCCTGSSLVDVCVCSDGVLKRPSTLVSFP